VKGEKAKPVFEEPPNPTNVEASLQQMKANDPSLQEVNLNNIKVCPFQSWTSLTDCFYSGLWSFQVTDFRQTNPVKRNGSIRSVISRTF
jgi:hypothetical protein